MGKNFGKIIKIKREKVNSKKKKSKKSKKGMTIDNWKTIRIITKIKTNNQSTKEKHQFQIGPTIISRIRIIELTIKTEDMRNLRISNKNSRSNIWKNLWETILVFLDGILWIKNCCEQHLILSLIQKMNPWMSWPSYGKLLKMKNAKTKSIQGWKLRIWD